MWVKRGSLTLFNETLAETNLAKNPALIILEKDGEVPPAFQIRTVDCGILVLHALMTAEKN